MRIIRYFNNRVKKLTIFDVKLVQLCAMLVALIVVKLIPDIMAINTWWFVVLLVLSAIRPLWAFFLKS